MCARLFLPTSPEDLAEFLEIDMTSLPELTPRYNIAPGHDVLVVRRVGAERRPAFLRWGLVPRFAESTRGAHRLINARSETAARRGVFRESLLRRRCAVPAAGFYEWKKMGRVRQPFAIRPRAGLVAVAGLWDVWEREGQRLESCTLLTTEPNEAIAAVHDRMPVLLGREQIEAWLDPAREAPEDLARFWRPYPARKLVVEPVSTRVNRVDFDDPSCLTPLSSPLPEQSRLF
jgi:putative SOS response-associated peptidase YedK